MNRCGLLGGDMLLSAWRASLIVDVMVTTVCDRRCPICCVKGILGDRSFPAESVARDVAALGDVGLVVLTGGEPTLHPDLAGVVRQVVEARKASESPLSRYTRKNAINLVTNGARLVEKADCLVGLNAVLLSVFRQGGGAGKPTDLAVIKDFERVCPEGVRFIPRTVVHKEYRTGVQPCGRHWRTASVMDGRIYSCCVACGIEGASSTDLSPGWEERLLNTAPPCGKCLFGMAEDPTGMTSL